LATEREELAGGTEHPDVLSDPDASTQLSVDRTRLSYERTKLSWVRTATSLITFGFSIQQFFRMAAAGAPPQKGLIGPHEFGVTMIVIGLLALLLATLEHRKAIEVLKLRYPAAAGYPSIRRSHAGHVAALIALLGLLALVSMIVHG
jgi:putative membrane protein